MADRDGLVRHANDYASAVMPDPIPGVPLRDAVPAWLAEAHQRVVAMEAAGDGRAVSGPVGERSFEAHPTVQSEQGVAWRLVDEIDSRLAVDALHVERRRIAFLAEASNGFLSSLDSERCMDLTAHLAANHFGDAAVVVAPVRGSRLPVATCQAGGPPRRAEREVDPRDVPGLAEALQGFPPVPSRLIDPKTVAGWLIPDGFGEVGSIVITPLPGHGTSAGALILLRRASSVPFDEEEEIVARMFAARSGAALSAARLYTEQASVSQTLIRELLPPVLHQISGIDFAGGYRPSKDRERVGGDFYDVHPPSLEGGRSLAVLGDVCGKGLEAAILAGKIRNMLHALLPMGADHQRMIELLNRALLTSDGTRFATMVMVSAVRAQNSVSLRVTSAGHPPVLVVRADGSVEVGKSTGTLIGVLPDASATTVNESLAPGDFCVLITDGFTEARGGPTGDELFGDDRLRRALSDCAGMPAEAVVTYIQVLASDWVGAGTHDDMAIMVIAAPRTQHLGVVDKPTRDSFAA
ncbi:PP2C family protein-serine/threonine phosphatase [Streptomyces sp. NPDC058459]|uniref:PP2C family protein-serine/threonine phosphatase n=1 Tax=Streptomyces sp. NPDC058459 TaxID=3346508 RepID=UPI00365296C0